MNPRALSIINRDDMINAMSDLYRRKEGSHFRGKDKFDMAKIKE